MPHTVTAQAPGRVNLIGEHTDYNDGLCLPIAIPYRTVVTATARLDGDGGPATGRGLRIRSDGAGAWEGSLASAGPGAVEGWAAYAAGTLWALAEAGHPLEAVEMAIRSDVPVGAGLSSSAALEAAVAVAAWGVLDRPLDDDARRLLVEVCRRAEGEVVGAPTGGLDQTAVLTTVEDAAVLLDFAAGTSEVVPLGWGADGLDLILIDTRVSHALVDGGYGDRRAECRRAAAALGLTTLREADAEAVARLEDDVLRRRARHIVTENDRVEATVAAARVSDWAAVGALFDASHASMRDDFEISCPELDLAVATARDAGALGARMTGGGFGGSAIALVPHERAVACRRAVDAAFAAAGFGAPAHLDGTPSSPAGLLTDE